MSQIRCPNCNCTAIMETFGVLKCLNCGNQDFSNLSPKLSQLADFDSSIDESPKNVSIIDKQIIDYFLGDYVIDDDFSLLSQKNSSDLRHIFCYFKKFHGNTNLKTKIMKFILSESNDCCKTYAIQWMDDETLSSSELRSLLDSSDDYLRLIALNQLNKNKLPDGIIEKLITILEHDPNKKCRILSFKAIIAQKASLQISLLTHILERSSDASVRLYVFKLLLKQKIPIKISSIIIALNDDNKKIIQLALNEAALIKDISFIEPIKKIYYKNPDYEIKLLVINTLCEFGKKTAKEAKLMASK